MSYASVFLPVLLAVLLSLLIKHTTRKRGLPLPPGPKGLPFVGNALQMPKEREYRTFTEWGKQYGDILFLRLFSQPIVVLNAPQLAIEMLDKKSAIYSDRPRLEFGGEMVGWNRTLVMTPYGDRFREYRRLMHQTIGGRNQIKRFDEFREKETHKFLKYVLRHPDQYYNQLRKTISGIVLNLSHGYETQEGSDPFINQVEEALIQLGELFRPGTFLVDILPILRFVPTWFPGAGFKKTADAWRKTLENMTNIPYEYVKTRIADGTNVPNYTSSLLENQKYKGEKEDYIKWSASSLYSGGSDTTVATVRSFWLAMTLYPEVQRKAQEEIDRVIGSDRLPAFTDRESLPYLEALVSEVHRWTPVTPLGAPHRLLQDDEHAGYHIPNGSIVMPNIHAFTHDPDVYEDPYSFVPERFIAKEGKTVPPDPRTYCFGFGRRMCPALHFGDSAVWITAAMALSVFNIEKVVENGEVVEPLHEWTTGIIIHPKPWKCSIKPRSPKAEALIMSEDL